MQTKKDLLQNLINQWNRIENKFKCKIRDSDDIRRILKIEFANLRIREKCFFPEIDIM